MQTFDETRPTHEQSPRAAEYAKPSPAVPAGSILDDKGAMSLIYSLRERGYGLKQVREAMSVLEILDLPEAERGWKMAGVMKPLADGENGIRWVHYYGGVWLLQSSTQVDYCGSLATWKMPEHARAAIAKAEGGVK